MTKQPPISEEVLRGISQVIGDTNAGLSGSEIGHLLANAKIADTDPTLTKWRRLFNAFANWQNQNQCSNNIYDFISRVMNPVSYMGSIEAFEWRRTELNKRLVFVGLIILETGKIGRLPKAATTIKEAEQRADELRRKLSSRSVHQDVLRFCRAELLADNYFHAVFETTKSVADKIRVLSGLTGDGNELVDGAFAINNPKLAINTLQTETERSEHKGFANLLKGFFGMFRNTTAHAPRVQWEIKEEDALDIMSLASLCHRRLDQSTRVIV
ncbi:TIGR02391 family protein [Dyadobacter sp. SG02]|uniref:TIGR02391 family protein n=1 Tax=Dyadobacter sp. SG02 TaxID=1855291 RepID=UPI0008ABCE48|nr:TIGR02391 family protein [Dyadobacter sp. SG02]SEI82843.1 TIGR02391 family protein [Dyadobacter sp. SG02]